MPASLENSAVTRGLEKVSFLSNAKECLNYQTVALVSQAAVCGVAQSWTWLKWLSSLAAKASEVMLKSLQARLQQYVNHELPDVQAGFRKGRGTRDQIANISWIINRARESQKNIYFCFIDYAKSFDCVDHDKLWKALREMGIPDHLPVSCETCMWV